MKIIFNHTINDWYWQIYDELNRNYELIIPDNYKTSQNQDISVNLESLERCVKENSDYDLIFDFRGNLSDLIKWKQKKLEIPLVIFLTNAINRPSLGKLTIFSKVWFVEQYAKPLMEMYDLDNLLYYGMAANPYIYYPLKTEKIYDVGFFGQHYGERANWIKNLQRFCIKNHFKGYFPKGHGVNLPWTYDQINEFYNQTKINITFAQKQKPGRIVNLRTFEICMSGNFQLMQYSPCVEEFFDVDEEIICWKTKNDLFEKTIYFMENTDERERIAKKGFKRAIENHTWSKRFEKIGSILKSREQINLENYIIKINTLLENNEVSEIQNVNSSLELFKFILKGRGFKVRRDLKKKKFLKINFKDEIFKYKPNLQNFYFIEFYGKVMIISEVLNLNSKIRLKHWYDLKKIIYLTENADLSVPQFGIITNGIQWVIYDFKNRTWLKNLPNQVILKSTIPVLKYFFLRFIYRCKIFYKGWLSSRIKSKSNILLKYLKSIYTKLITLLGSESSL
ncbi:MAG: glycosyltransferase [Promethearchaeota archaeon]